MPQYYLPGALSLVPGCQISGFPHAVVRPLEAPLIGLDFGIHLEAHWSVGFCHISQVGHLHFHSIFLYSFLLAYFLTSQSLQFPKSGLLTPSVSPRVLYNLPRSLPMYEPLTFGGTCQWSWPPLPLSLGHIWIFLAITLLINLAFPNSSSLSSWWCSWLPSGVHCSAMYHLQMSNQA